MSDFSGSFVSVKIKIMTDETNKSEENEIDASTEKVESVGQIILGEIEKIGGILTADPQTQAEGEYNISAGTLRAEVADDLEESEDK